MANIIDSILPIVSILRYWAIVLGSFGGPAYIPSITIVSHTYHIYIYIYISYIKIRWASKVPKRKASMTKITGIQYIGHDFGYFGVPCGTTYFTNIYSKIFQFFSAGFSRLCFDIVLPGHHGASDREALRGSCLGRWPAASFALRHLWLG